MRRRARSTQEGPFGAPERLAFALPLVAAFGLALVVFAAGTGQSAPVVALLAVAGFGLCALAPMALVELYVGRPLRAALTQLRAARDGQEPSGAAPDAGVIGDLVAIARDIRAGHATVGPLRGALTHWEQMAAAGDEAVRAFRLRSVELVEAAAQHAAQTQFVEISEALKAAAPAAAVEGAMARIEQRLTQLAQMWERGEDTRADERFERSLSEIVQLVGHETRTLRNDVSSRVADDQLALVERLETFEARLLDKLAGAEATPSPPPEWPLARLDEGFANAASAAARLWDEQARRLDGIEASIAQGAREGEAKALAVLGRTTEKLRNAIDRLDALSAAAANLNGDGLRQAFEGGVARLASGQAQAQAILTRLDAGAAAFEAQANQWTLVAGVEAQTIAALRLDIGTVKARVAEIGPRVAASTQALARSLGERLDLLGEAAAAPHATLLQMLREDRREVGESVRAALAPFAARFEASEETAEWRASLETLGDRLAETLGDLERRLAAPDLAA